MSDKQTSMIKHTSHSNSREGPCCHCGETCVTGKETFDRVNGKWKPLHLACRSEFKEKQRINRLQYWAQGTGKRAQRARKTLRELE